MSHVRRRPAAAGRPATGPRTVESDWQRFATKCEAQQFLERVGTDRQQGQWRDPAGARVRHGDWVEDWWATTVNLRPPSRARDDTYLRNHVLPVFGRPLWAGSPSSTFGHGSPT